MNDLSNFASALTVSEASASSWAGILLLAVLSFILGFALNRGSICTVIATDELVSKGRPARSLALLESALWAGLIYALLPSSPHMPHGWLPPVYLLLGTFVFALGSYLNRACVFGSIGHFGNGQIEFALVFIGIFLVTYFEPITHLLPITSPVDLAPPDNVLLLSILLLLLLAVRRSVTRREEGTFWLLGFTMAAVGITFALLITFTPLFSITASLKSVVTVPVAGGATVVGMLLGSMVSGYLREGPFTFKRPTWKGMARHLGGGMLMGLGAALVPGGNDTLLLVGLPGGAWQAFASYALLVAILATFIKGSCLSE